MNDTKRVGRPRNFDEDRALEAAVNLFWMKGFDGASMKELANAMGINGPSIYAAFGDKRDLFLKAIDSYAGNDACAPLVAFESEPDITTAVEAFMKAAVQYATDHKSGARGCFLASSVATSAGEVEGVEELLGQAIHETDQRLAARFEEEKRKGTLPPDFPSLDRARLLFDLRQGHVFRARAGLSDEAMLADVKQRAAMVLDHPL